jgi:hypothetical protein
MSFLDSLESNLKSLESRDETALGDKEDRKKREAERAYAQAASPYAEQLRTGAFTNALLSEATRIGHSKRIKINIAWLGSVLRLEARDKKLELRPTPEGVVAAFLENNVETESQGVDLNSDPAALAHAWLG